MATQTQAEIDQAIKVLRAVVREYRRGVVFERVFHHTIAVSENPATATAAAAAAMAAFDAAFPP